MDVSWMYAKNPRKDTPEKKPKFTGSKKFYIEAGIAAFLIIGGLLTFYFIYEKNIGVDTETPELTECARTLNSYKEGRLSVILCVKKDGSLSIFWQNLPKDTKIINIYRTEEGGTGPTLWRTVEVTGESGSLNLGQEEGGPAIYSVQGVNENGTTAWNSTGTTKSNGSQNATGTPGAGQSSTSSSQTSNPGQQNPTPTSPPVTPPSQNPTSTTTPPPTTPPPPTSTSTQNQPNDTSTIYYYTPSGQVSGTSSISTASFWVQHVNQKIEIGWQNIPSSTTKVIIYRSETETSGYAKLLEQTNLQTSYVIRIEDNAVHEDFYYKMEAKNGSTLISTYGPFFLQGLQ